MRISVVIRTFNEDRYLEELLRGIRDQDVAEGEVEVVLVDSGSTDRTLEIAASHGCTIVHIEKQDFSFGRSLNLGCAAARGEFLVFISGHCVPASRSWLSQLVRPFVEGIQGAERVAYAYGRQLGGPESRFSERQLFNKYFPEVSQVPQKGFFCNNANAALRKRVWQAHPFDETLTGLEDMHLAKKLLASGWQLAYVAEAPVYHYHHESWSQVRRRYEREAIALQHIMPEVHVSWLDFLRYFASAVFLDTGAALEQKVFWSRIREILTFRLMQFWGSYRGNHEHRQLSRKMKELYFYPR